MSVHPGAAAVLRDTIGLQHVDESDPLHMRLVQAVLDAGAGASFGARIVALRYVFNWELLDAGRQFAEAKTAYEAHLTRQKVLHLSEPKMSVARAEILAEGSEGAYELKLKFLLAEQRERAMRNFLQTLHAALELHRTDRADERAADRAHAQGYTGGA